MFSKIARFFLGVRDRQRIGIALSKGGAMMNARNVDLTQPSTWEFSGFSQNGEDGIIQILRRQLLKSNRYFIEIGAADGIDNNSAWLAAAEKCNGIMIEGNPRLVERAQAMIGSYSIGTECYQMFVTKNNINKLKDLAFYADPDVFSLDIDGNDYYVAQSILSAGFRPKIFVVEYNSVYGPSRSITVEYQENFAIGQAHPSQLYYGVSIAGWRNFFKQNGYQFVTVDQNGVNGFFVDPAFFDADFLAKIKGLDFAENQYQFKKFRKPSAEQFKMIQDQKFVTI